MNFEPHIDITTSPIEFKFDHELRESERTFTLRATTDVNEVFIFRYVWDVGFAYRGKYKSHLNKI